MLKKLIGLYLLGFVVGMGIGKFIIVPMMERNKDRKEKKMRELEKELMNKMKEEMVAKRQAEEYKRMENLQTKTTEELLEEIDRLFTEMGEKMDYEDACRTFEERIENDDKEE